MTPKRALLGELFDDEAFKRVIVFTRTKRGADRVARSLEQVGIDANSIHGDKSQGQRERALAEATTADQALAAGKSLGPLHGVPCSIKDSHELQGVRSTGGTLGRKDHLPSRDATYVARVRQAGAIVPASISGKAQSKRVNSGEIRALGASIDA